MDKSYRATLKRGVKLRGLLGDTRGGCRDCDVYI